MKSWTTVTVLQTFEDFRKGERGEIYKYLYRQYHSITCFYDKRILLSSEGLTYTSSTSYRNVWVERMGTICSNFRTPGRTSGLKSYVIVGVLSQSIFKQLQWDTVRWGNILGERGGGGPNIDYGLQGASLCLFNI